MKIIKLILFLLGYLFLLQTLGAESAVTFKKEEGSLSINFKIHRENGLNNCFLVKVKDQKITQICFSEGVTKDAIRDHEERGFFRTIAEGSIGNLPFYCLVFENRNARTTEVFRVDRGQVIVTKKVDEGIFVDLRVDEKLFLEWFGSE